MDLIGGITSKATARPRIFPSLCDWLDDAVPIDWLVDFLQLIHDTPNLDWLLLTKRPENFFDRIRLARNHGLKQSLPVIPGWCYMTSRWINKGAKAPSNVWIGVSTENQAMADKRIPQLLKIPAKLHFLSVEPMLDAIDLDTYLLPSLEDAQKAYRGVDCDWPRIHWIIVGGESGPRARQCETDWIRDVIGQCKTASVPCFVKQIGRHPGWNDKEMDERWYERLSHPKGGDMSEWPEDLRVREFPKEHHDQPS